MEHLPRHITRNIIDALSVSPIVFLNGARQAGKSTLVQVLANEMIGRGNPVNYVSFDRPTQMAAAAAAPEAFLSAYPDCLIIDEVQMVPELFRTLKIIVDETRLINKAKANGKYLLTGSVNIMALPKLADPLVGRMSVLTLYPFCTAETIGGKGDGLRRILDMQFNNLNNKDLNIIEAIKSGTFPEISGKSYQQSAIWLDGYITTILQRDVRMLAELEKVSVLPTLLRILATRAGSLMNDSDISRDAGLNAVTGKLYRNILKMMFLNFDVKPWFRNIGKRLVKAPKGYLTDTLLLCHMLDLKLEHIMVDKPELFGHILENYVATELTKLISFSDVKVSLLHFRTSDGKEVDFVLERPDGTVFGIEVKRSEVVNMHDFKGLNALEGLIGEDFTGGIVLYAGKEAVPFGKNLWAVPYCVLWQ